MCVSSFFRRAFRCMSQIKRLHAVHSPSEVCDQLFLNHYPLPFCSAWGPTDHTEDGQIRVAAGAWTLCWLYSAAAECALLLGANEVHNVFHLVKKPTRPNSSKIWGFSVQCILSSSTLKRSKPSFYSWSTESWRKYSLCFTGEGVCLWELFVRILTWNEICERQYIRNNYDHLKNWS